VLDRKTLEAFAVSRDREMTMAPRGLDVDALLSDVIDLLDEREASETVIVEQDGASGRAE
jgi:hypothetical protein